MGQAEQAKMPVNPLVPGFQANSSILTFIVDKTKQQSLVPHGNMTTSLLSQGTQNELVIFAASCLEGSLLDSLLKVFLP